MWHLYGIWYALTIVRYLDTQVREREARIVKLESELREWQGKFLSKVNTTPLFHNPPPVAPPAERPPVGPTEKRAMLSRVPPPTERTDEDILRAADEAARQANGHG